MRVDRANGSAQEVSASSAEIVWYTDGFVGKEEVEPAHMESNQEYLSIYHRENMYRQTNLCDSFLCGRKFRKCPQKQAELDQFR